MQPPTASTHDELAFEHALAAGDVAVALTQLSLLAPQWYRQGRHAQLCQACDRWVAASTEVADLPEGLALWRALATWYVAPSAALTQLRQLARRRGLLPGRPPAAMPQLGDDLYLLAALFRSELATQADPAELSRLATSVLQHLDAPGRAQAAVLCQLGGVTAALAWLSLTGAEGPRLQGLNTESLHLVARLNDRDSLCSVVALARWPLLRGDMAQARETCELITVGLLAGDDAHMPLAHGWLMSVQAELARPGSGDLLRAWADGSMARDALLTSPIAPTLLCALALLDAQAPPGVQTDIQGLVLARQEAWSPLERWLARAARCWAHLRDGDVPAARALVRLLVSAPSGADSLLSLCTLLLDAQVRLLAGQPLPLLPDPAALQARGWPGPALLVQLLHWAANTQPVQAPEVQACLTLWREQALLLPLFAAPAVVQRALARLELLDGRTVPNTWLAALRSALGRADSAPVARVQIRLLDGLAIEVDGSPLALGRKPPRRLLELTALLALHAPHEQPAHRLADALYPELDGDAALRALDTALYRLRRLLPPGALRRGATGLALDATVVSVARDGPAERWLPEFEQPWAEAARRSA
jgi:hypothetical protein